MRAARAALVVLAASSLAIAGPMIGDRDVGVVTVEHQPLVAPSALFPGNVDRPPVPHWVVDLPGGQVNSASHAERTRPVVVGEHILVGSAAGNALYMLSRRDGGVVRSFPANGSVDSEPAVVGDRVYFADTIGTAWCYALDGTEVWRRDLGAPILTRPTLDGDAVYFTTVDDLVVALHSGSGELDWRYQRPPNFKRGAELTLFSAPPAVRFEGLVLVGFSDGALVGLDASTGEVQWQHGVGEGRYPDIIGAPVAFGDDVYVAGFFLPLVAFDVRSRTVRWRQEVGAANAGLVDGTRQPTKLYHPGADGKLRAIATITGARQWIWDSGTGGALTTPVVTDAGLLVASTEGGVFLIDPETGTEVWRYHESVALDGSASAPVVDGRQILFVTNAGRLHSLVVPQRAGQLLRTAFPLSSSR